MYLKNQIILVTASILALGAATAARADVTISSDATQNMSCSGGICAPTASNAVLNVGDLENLLASGNVTVTTTGSGVQASNIDITANLGWSANALTLDAYQSISVTAPVTVSGADGLSIITNDGGSGGELAFYGNGHTTFTKLSGRLSINGASYKLVDTISSMAAAIEGNPSGNYALASDYNAAKDGTYSVSPIQTVFTGAFEGLGNRISNPTIVVPIETSAETTGLFAEPSGTISDLGVVHARVEVDKVKGRKRFVVASVGILAGLNGGTISRCNADGTLSVPKYTAVGGLVGTNEAAITESEASVSLKLHTGFAAGGGLVGENNGKIIATYATGSITGTHSNGGEDVGRGGLVGLNSAEINNSYTSTRISGGEASGGLVGGNVDTITASYSTGSVRGPYWVGGLIGDDSAQAGSLTDTYWDTDTSGVTNMSQGAGNVANDPGITGLSTAQLQSGLPAGFDPTVWGENPNINNGLLYLLVNPPQWDMSHPPLEGRGIACSRR